MRRKVTQEVSPPRRCHELPVARGRGSPGHLFHESTDTEKPESQSFSWLPGSRFNFAGLRVLRSFRAFASKDLQNIRVKESSVRLERRQHRAGAGQALADGDPLQVHEQLAAAG